MILNQSLPIIYDKDVQSIDFFHDFIAFLNWLKEKPIKRTITGNISLRDIELLLPELITSQKIINEYRDYGWRLHSEQELQTLTQMKIIAEVMHLTYKRKGRLFLSRNGHGFLTNLSTVQQYGQMVLHYWYRVNWEYFSPSKEIDGQALSELLQKKQNYFWLIFLQKETLWIDYKKFCIITRDYFQLQPFFQDKYFDENYELLSDINHSLFRKNLVLLGCVDIEETSNKNGWQKEIKTFRPTPIGLYVFHKALYENYLNLTTDLFSSY